MKSLESCVHLPWHATAWYNVLKSLFQLQYFSSLFAHCYFLQKKVLARWFNYNDL